MSAASTDPRRAARRSARATTPGHSVWVAASAGTGKTKVLTDRVLAPDARRHRPDAHPLPDLHQGRRRRDGEPPQRRSSAAGRSADDGDARAGDRAADRRAARRSRASPARAGCSPACSTRPAASRSRPSTPSASRCCGASRSRPGCRRISSVIDERSAARRWPTRATSSRGAGARRTRRPTWPRRWPWSRADLDDEFAELMAALVARARQGCWPRIGDGEAALRARLARRSACRRTRPPKACRRDACADARSMPRRCARRAQALAEAAARPIGTRGALIAAWLASRRRRAGDASPPTSRLPHRQGRDAQGRSPPRPR